MQHFVSYNVNFHAYFQPSVLFHLSYAFVLLHVTQFLHFQAPLYHVKFCVTHGISKAQKLSLTIHTLHHYHSNLKKVEDHLNLDHLLFVFRQPFYLSISITGLNLEYFVAFLNLNFHQTLLNQNFSWKQDLSNFLYLKFLVLFCLDKLVLATIMYFLRLIFLNQNLVHSNFLDFLSQF